MKGTSGKSLLPSAPGAPEEGVLKQQYDCRQGKARLLGELGGNCRKERDGVKKEPRRALGGPPLEIARDRKEVEKRRQGGEPLGYVGDRLRLNRMGREEKRGHESDRQGVPLYPFVLQGRGPEEKKRDGENQRRVEYVDDNVEEVVAEGIEAAVRVVEREREVCQIPRRGRPQKGRVPYLRVVDYVHPVIEDERAVEHIGIDDESKRRQSGERDSLAKTLHAAPSPMLT